MFEFQVTRPVAHGLSARLIAVIRHYSGLGVCLPDRAALPFGALNRVMPALRQVRSVPKESKMRSLQNAKRLSFKSASCGPKTLRKAIMANLAEIEPNCLWIKKPKFLIFANV